MLQHSGSVQKLGLMHLLAVGRYWSLAKVIQKVVRSGEHSKLINSLSIRIRLLAKNESGEALASPAHPHALYMHA